MDVAASEFYTEDKKYDLDFKTKDASKKDKDGLKTGYALAFHLYALAFHMYALAFHLYALAIHLYALLGHTDTLVLALPANHIYSFSVAMRVVSGLHSNTTCLQTLQGENCSGIIGLEGMRGKWEGTGSGEIQGKRDRWTREKSLPWSSWQSTPSLGEIWLLSATSPLRKWFGCHRPELMEMYKSFCKEYPIITIEDPFDQDDWENTTAFTLEGVSQVRDLFPLPPPIPCVINLGLLVGGGCLCGVIYRSQLPFLPRFRGGLFLRNPVAGRLPKYLPSSARPPRCHCS